MFLKLITMVAELPLLQSPRVFRPAYENSFIVIT